jgi:hypothetical protein
MQAPGILDTRNKAVSSWACNPFLILWWIKLTGTILAPPPPPIRHTDVHIDNFSFIFTMKIVFISLYFHCFTDLVLSLIQESVLDPPSVGGGLLVTDKGRSAFRSANHCQGQLQTAQSVTLTRTNMYVMYNRQQIWHASDLRRLRLWRVYYGFINCDILWSCSWNNTLPPWRPKCVYSCTGPQDVIT